MGSIGECDWCSEMGIDSNIAFSSILHAVPNLEAVLAAQAGKEPESVEEESV